MEVGLVRKIDIDDEMQQSYLDYAMSVIVARALPDARDGLKPVHRRILHAMYAMGIRPDSTSKKSARIVGEVLGKFHPHGDMAVYDAMVRMAQEFSMRYPLVDGQGNFGSIDGDPAAAMRYTEAKLTPLAIEMLADIEKNTVEFEDNFDATLQEPTVLPAAAPNLLVNGATGIAVGMSTSIPPHNMGEVCDALIHLLENWKNLEKISLDDLMKYIQGPDFPTGGIILRGAREGEGLLSAYGTGRGKITVQARAHMEDMGRGRSRIIVTELPYQTNKSNLIERIADLAREGKLEGLTDLRDESDRQGMRIVLELTKSADPEHILSELYRRTPMQTTFSMIILALVEGQPRLLNLKQALRVFIEHRHEIVARRSRYELERAQEREHILEGLRVALADLDAVIDLIRRSKDASTAQTRLMRSYKLTEIQARAILDTPLRRLANLERRQIEQEYKEVKARIKELTGLLRSEAKMRQLIADELRALKTQYADRRRTLIVEMQARRKAGGVLTASDLAPDKDLWVVLTQDGRLSRTTTARLPRISGRAAPKLVVGANTRDTLYLFDEQGEAAAVAVHTLPECEDPSTGSPLNSLTAFGAEANVAAGIALEPGWMKAGAAPAYLLFGTRKGMVKKTELAALPGPSAKRFQGIKVGKGDRLGWIQLSTGTEDVLMITSAGMGIRFPESDVRPMGLVAAGVLGIRLGRKGEEVVGMGLLGPKSEVLLLTERGEGKRTAAAKFPTQGRYGKGVLAWKSGEEVRLAGAAIGAAGDRVIARIARRADRSIRIGDAVRRARNAAGRALFEVTAKDKVTGLQPILERPKEPSLAPEKKKSTKKKAKPAAKAAKGKAAAKKTKGKAGSKGGKPKKRSSAKKK